MRRHAGVFGLVVAVTLGGCTQVALIEPRPICDFNVVAARSAPAEVPTAPSPVTQMPLNAVNITDYAITNKIVVQSTNARRNASGTVEVWARLVNCTDYPLQVEGRTHFLDEAQSPIEDVSGWNRVFLPARSYAVYSEHSTNSVRVKYYLVELREGR